MLALMLGNTGIVLHCGRVPPAAFKFHYGYANGRFAGANNLEGWKRWLQRILLNRCGPSCRTAPAQMRLYVAALFLLSLLGFLANEFRPGIRGVGGIEIMQGLDWLSWMSFGLMITLFLPMFPRYVLRLLTGRRIAELKSSSMPAVFWSISFILLVAAWAALSILNKMTRLESEPLLQALRVMTAFFVPLMWDFPFPSPSVDLRILYIGLRLGLALLGWISLLHAVRCDIRHEEKARTPPPLPRKSSA
jgi:hypothetical protein